MATQKLTKRVIDGATPTSVRYCIWDAQVAGFGVRVTSSGIKTFILRYRTKGRSAIKRYVTLGRFGVVTVEQAREGAKRLLGSVAHGDDPALKENQKRSALLIDEAAVRLASCDVANRIAEALR